MKTCCRLAISILIVMTCWTANVYAETRYVSDQLVVALREQPQKGAATITYLRTDMAVEILEETEGFVKIKTQAGEIGYIKPNYLTPNTPKSAIIKKLQRERDQLADKAVKIKQQAATETSQSNKSQKELTAQLTANRKELAELQNKLNKSQDELNQTNQAYQALQKDAKNVVAITKERDQLRNNNQTLAGTIAKLEKETGELAKTGVIKWFLAGAGVLFFGWLIGKSSGNRRRRTLL